MSPLVHSPPFPLIFQQEEFVRTVEDPTLLYEKVMTFVIGWVDCEHSMMQGGVLVGNEDDKLNSLWSIPKDD